MNKLHVKESIVMFPHMNESGISVSHGMRISPVIENMHLFGLVIWDEQGRSTP